MSKQLAEAKNDLIIAQANYIKGMNKSILAKQVAHSLLEDSLAFAQEYHDHLNKLQKILNEEGALYVVAYGTDCDGSNSGHITGYTDLDKAIDSVNISNEASDGLRFVVVGKKEAEYYCQSFMRNFDEVHFSKQ
jgi:hypothetical protein